MKSTQQSKYSIIVTTTDSKKEAREISRSLLLKKLCACIQIEKVESIYIWKGEICNSSEYKITAKTTSSKSQEVQQEITKMHSYETPEIIEIPIISGSGDYLNWIEESANPKS